MIAECKRSGTTSNDRPYRGPSELGARPSFVGTPFVMHRFRSEIGNITWVNITWAQVTEPTNVDSLEAGPRSTIPKWATPVTPNPAEYDPVLEWFFMNHGLAQ
jgi:hypothetical protein